MNTRWLLVLTFCLLLVPVLNVQAEEDAAGSAPADTCWCETVMDVLPSVQNGMTGLFRLDPDHLPDWILFLGRFHPLLVHLPIGILLGLLLLEGFALVRWTDEVDRATQYLCATAAWSSLVAVVAGTFLSLSGEYGEALLQRHTWLGLLLMVMAFVLWRIKAAAAKSGFMGLRVLYAFWLLLTMALLPLATHYGGAMTHGSSYLTRYMPAGLQSMLKMESSDPAPVVPPPPVEPGSSDDPVGVTPGAEPGEGTDVASPTLYAAHIAPLLEARCVACHGAEKIKGKLRMDSLEELLKGGISGPALVAGDPAASRMMQLVQLPPEHDDIMPPKGDPLTGEEIRLLDWWIAQGARGDQPAADLPGDLVPAAPAAPAPVETVVTSPEAAPGSTPVAGEAEILSWLETHGAVVSPIAQDQPLLNIDLGVSRTALTPEHLDHLARLGERVGWLNLAGTGLDDDGLAALSSLVQLERLRAEQTALTDAGLPHLKAFSQLRYLNLYGTGITDPGLTVLAALPALEQVYLWQTPVTEDGLAALRTQCPELEVVVGAEAPPTTPDG